MCGIAGILDIKRKPENHVILGMTGIMRHRGPDGEGIYIDGPVGLGHRRLSIIDINTGAQPMSNEDGSVWITYNGEVYNFMELRNELESRGHKFRTKSDTETIIHAYEQYGEDCVKKLRGMFAFCIWDAKKKSLFLARDRLGKKPLYYFYDKSRFVFASEIKAVISDKRIKRELDLSAVSDYFTYQYIPFPKTIFKNIYKLPPGHFMTVQQQLPEQAGEVSINIRQYWDIEYNPDYSVSEHDWVDGLREKLLDAVKVRLISDVPLGAFLSGGLDSSSIVAFMSRVMNQPVKTFSIGFEEADFSELEYARKIAKQYGTEHHEMIIKPDAIGLLPKLAWEFDEPFADSSVIPTYYVSKMARENVTVVLSGDGGDETFAGYSRYASACRFNNQMSLIPSLFRHIVFGGISSLMPYGMRGKGFLRHLTLTPFEYYKGMITQDDHYFEELLDKDVMKKIISQSKSDNGFSGNNNGVLEQFYNRYPDADYLTKIQYLDTKTYLAEDILTKVDRASMLCSLETRAPLLDHELLEFAARIPAEYKIKNGCKKYIFKKAMSDSLPPDILNRNKMGFCTPLIHWFKKDLTGYAEDMLLGERCRNRGFFNVKFIESLISNHRLKYRDLSSHIWQLLFFEHWCRNWLDS